jgi:hypothetical protein
MVLDLGGRAGDNVLQHGLALLYKYCILSIRQCMSYVSPCWRNVCYLKLDNCIALGYVHIYKGSPHETLWERVTAGASSQTVWGVGLTVLENPSKS